MELIYIIINRKINTLCINETKRAGKKAKGIDSVSFKLWYSNRSQNRAGDKQKFEK